MTKPPCLRMSNDIETRKSNPKRTRTLSVTLVVKETLPSYSCERFYLLSEIELKGHSTHFLSDWQYEDSTQETEISHDSQDHPPGESPGVGIVAPREAKVPDYMILYLLWTPDMTSNVEEFTRTIILTHVSRLEERIELVSLELEHQNGRDTATNPSSLSPIAGSSSLSNNSGEDYKSGEEVNHGAMKKQTRLYICVDRVNPFASTARATDPHLVHLEQEELTHNLVKQVAAHPKLRNICQGITVGVSNHERATPGLEALVNALDVGHSDRWTIKLDRGNIGVATDHPDIFLGLQSTEATNLITQDVLQSRVTAEWNGLGNLILFARRAHCDWCIAHGVRPLPVPMERRKIPRRIRPLPTIRVHHPPPGSIPGPALGMSRQTEALIYDVMAVLSLMVYMFYHFHKERLTMSHFDVSTLLEDAIQYLREILPR